MPRTINYGKPVSSNSINTGLVAWWKCLPNWMGGVTWRDLCGQYHGTLTGLDITAAWKPNANVGGFGSINCPSGTQRIAFPSITSGTTYSAFAWVKTSGVAGWGNIITQDGGNGLFIKANKLDYYNGSDQSANTTLQANFWYHLGATVAAGALTFYVNGLQDGTASSITSANFNIIGSDTFNESIAGYIDDCRLYINRTLSASDVYQLYQDSLAGCPCSLAKRQLTKTYFSNKGSCITNGNSTLAGVGDGSNEAIETGIAIQTKFGSLTSYVYPGGYDQNKLGLGPLMVQSSGTGENNWVGPFPINVARPMETPGAVAGLYPTAISWSSTYDWVFMSDNATAAATRRFQLYRFNKTNITNPWSWIGFITCAIPFNGTQGVYTVSGLSVSYEKYTTGTVSINNGSATLTGSGTTWNADRIFIGSRIGFGSTDPASITVWYEIGAIGNDTSITLAQNFGESNISGASYVIEDLRLIWCAINGTTLSNGGLFMTAGLRYENFMPGGISISAATTVDKIRATYWLTDGNAVANSTNQACGGIAIDTRTSWTNQIVYVGDYASTLSRFQISNFRATMTVGGVTSGRDAIANTFVLNTGQQSVSGTVRVQGNLVLCTPLHGPRNGIKTLFWVTSSRIYSAETNNITKSSTFFQSGVSPTITTGGANTIGADNLNSLAYDSLTDRFLAFSLQARSFFTQYREDQGQWDRNILINIGQINQSTVDSTVAIWPNNLAAGFTGCVSNGMSYIVSIGTAATTNILYNVPYAADWEYASSTNCRVVLPAMDTIDFSQFIAGFVSPIEVIGGKTGNNLGIEPGAVRFYYRTSGISDNSGTWTLLDYTGSMSQVPVAGKIQGMMEFRTIIIQGLPARIARAGFVGVGETFASDSHFQLSQKHTDINNKLFAFRYSSAFGSTVPTLYLRIYDGVNSNLLVSDDSVTQAGTWEKSVDDGANWTLFNTSDRGNEITYLRFTPTSIADDVEVLPTVRLS